MALSRKHYQAIAAILKKHDGDAAEEGEYPASAKEYMRLDIAAALALYLEEESPNFDKERFLKAANYYDTYMGVR